MPRPVRVEYPGALYHVMARGDRKEAIVRDDEDRRTFVRALGQACQRSGFLVHAYVLMGNHYHLLLETPEANLSRGMAWLQNAFTRRINTRHRLWGHLFGGRYKAIAVEPGNCFWALLDYIHLNPVRAGMVKSGQGLESYAWSSLPGYLVPARKRPEWLAVDRGYEVVGVKDTARGRRQFLGALEKRIDRNNPARSGQSFPEQEGGPPLKVAAAVRRGWMFGSDAFREMLLKALAGKRIRRANGGDGRQLRDHGERQACRILEAGLRHFRLAPEELEGAPKGDWRKALLASMIQDETTTRLDWISERLCMGTRAGTCRLAAQARGRITRDASLRKARREILKMSIFNG